MVHIEPKYQVPRDFEGFGEEGFDAKWPNGARIAVSFVLNYEYLCLPYHRRPRTDSL